MVNAWSLAASILDGTFEEDYPLMEKSKKGWSEEDEIRELDDYYDFENVGSGNTAHSDYYMITLVMILTQKILLQKHSII